MADAEPQTKPRRRLPILIIVLALLLLATAGACLFFYLKYQEASKNPQADQQKVLQSIGTVLQLPGEQPTSFTISDKTKLTNQILADRVENGDTLFVYANAKKLVVYRPSAKKVVDMLSIEANAPLPVKQ